MKFRQIIITICFFGVDWKSNRSCLHYDAAQLFDSETLAQVPQKGALNPYDIIIETQVYIRYNKQTNESNKQTYKAVEIPRKCDNIYLIFSSECSTLPKSNYLDRLDFEHFLPFYIILSGAKMVEKSNKIYIYIA